MTVTPETRSPLPLADPASAGLDPERIGRLYEIVAAHVAEGRYPGAQVAFARHGKLLATRTFGQASIGPTARQATDDTLWLLYSQTKVVTAAAIWILVDRGALSFSDRIADHVPEFAARSKGEITLFQVLTHQAGYPSANVDVDAWADHELLRRRVSEFELEWWPGSRVQYHGAAAHWTAAVLIEAVTGRDYRTFIRRELLDPLGLSDIQVGVPVALQTRCVDMHGVIDGRLTPLGAGPAAAPRERVNEANFRAAGVPGGGGYATAASMAAFYQLLLGDGTLGGTRVLSPRMVQFVTRNHTGDRLDDAFGIPMHRGLGPHVRGASPVIRGLGAIASPRTFGHGGAGSSYSWGDPDSGLSFSYLTNCRSEEPWHSQRLDRISNLAHAALVEP
ncbi:MAG: beta-lactamase family protein [Chloroflexi bacterium]|nr:beta-lactamase family protein [Chloroflexota bacterium]